MICNNVHFPGTALKQLLALRHIKYSRFAKPQNFSLPILKTGITNHIFNATLTNNVLEYNGEMSFIYSIFGCTVRIYKISRNYASLCICTTLIKVLKNIMSHRVWENPIHMKCCIKKCTSPVKLLLNFSSILREIFSYYEYWHV